MSHNNVTGMKHKNGSRCPFYRLSAIMTEEFNIRMGFGIKMGLSVLNDLVTRIKHKNGSRSISSVTVTLLP